MYKKLMKLQIVGLCLFLCLGFMPTMPKVMAQEQLQTTNGVVTLQKGEGKIQLKGNENQTLVGKDFGIYQLFSAQSSKDGQSVVYHVNKTYEPALQQVVGKKLSKDPNTVSENEILATFEKQRTGEFEGNESNFRYFMEDVQKALVETKAQPVQLKVVDCIPETNNVEIRGLEYGYYTVVELTATNHTHAASSLCMVTTANPNSTIQVKSDYPTIVKKIKEDDNNIGWNDIADYEIGQTIPYKYTTNIPNMSGYKTYAFTFHDRMDNALLFDQRSVKVTMILEDGTSHVLANDHDYTINFLNRQLGNRQPNLEDGCRFEIMINDLKAIYQRLAPSKDTYKGQIVVEYNAKLSPLASNNTGRPGFENDVKLTFSNNPNIGHEGERGETPWDSVVCFTYTINGSKINDKGTVLEGAQFKLYRDEACEDQVFVNKEGNNYVVTEYGAPERSLIVSGKNGEFVIRGLDQGSYYLKEVKAPDGYRLLEHPIKITITPTFTAERNSYVKGDGAGPDTLQSLKAVATFKTFLDLGFQSYEEDLHTNLEDGSADLKVINKVGVQLPVTGSNLTLILVGAGVICMMIGFYESNKKKQKS